MTPLLTGLLKKAFVVIVFRNRNRRNRESVIDRLNPLTRQNAKQSARSDTQKHPENISRLSIINVSSISFRDSLRAVVRFRPSPNRSKRPVH